VRAPSSRAVLVGANADRARFRVTGGTGVFRGSRGIVDVGGAPGNNIRLVLRLS